MQEGTIRVPDYMNLVNSPTLWTYFETLPSWARADPIVRNVMMSMEYHKTGLDIRHKENALNMVVSMMRPIDGNYKKMIAEAAISQKVQMNMKLGQRMITELQFYEIDEQYLGSESEDFEGGADDQDKDITQILRQKADEDADDEVSPMEAAMKMMNEDARLDDMRAAAEQEMNINEY
jgi:hypothetical protein